MRPTPPALAPLLAALAAASLLAACGKPPGGPPPAEGTPVVGVMTVQPQRVTLDTELPGRTVPSWSPMSGPRSTASSRPANSAKAAT